MPKRATQFFKGTPVDVSLDTNNLRSASAKEKVGDSHLQLFKVRNTGKLVVAETVFYEALTEPPELPEDIEVLESQEDTPDPSKSDDDDNEEND